MRNLGAYLKNCIRGWLPKETSLPNNQKTKMIKASPQHRTLSTRTFGVLAFGSFLSGFFLLIFPYYYSPQSYTPKPNPARGYYSPNTVEAWIILTAALLLLVFSLFALSRWTLRLKTEGYRWGAKWVTPRAQTERERKIFKISVATSAIMTSVFLSAHFFTDPNVWSGDLTVISWIMFSLLLVLVNFVFYRYSKKQTKMGELKP